MTPVLLFALVIAQPSVSARADEHARAQLAGLCQRIDVPPSLADVRRVAVSPHTLMTFSSSQAELRLRICALRVLAIHPMWQQDLAIDSWLAGMLRSPERALRVHAAWGQVDRARRKSGVLELSSSLLQHGDPAVRTVAVHALWREGSAAARVLVERHQGVERDTAVLAVIARRLGAWPTAAAGQKAEPIPKKKL